MQMDNKGKKGRKKEKEKKKGLDFDWSKRRPRQTDSKS